MTTISTAVDSFQPVHNPLKPGEVFWRIDVELNIEKCDFCRRRKSFYPLRG